MVKETLIDSIKYKIIIRLLNLISNKREARETLYNKMNALYKARNTMVHGLEKESSLYKCIDSLGYEEIVRRIITVFIDTMKSQSLDHQKMIDKLDYDKTDIYEIDISNMNWKEDN